MSAARYDPPLGVRRPQCVHPVKPNRYGYHDRIRSAKSPDLCGRPAFYKIDGAAMCKAHAGHVTLMRALNPPPLESGWRGIEGAPRDGTWVFGYWKECPITAYPCVMFWGGGEWLSPAWTDFYPNPTHWQPLPLPPEPKGPGDE